MFYSCFFQFIDMNKDAALRSSVPEEDGIMTFGQVTKNFRGLFELTGRAAATLTTGNLDADLATDEFYGITFSIGSVFEGLGFLDVDEQRLKNLVPSLAANGKHYWGIEDTMCHSHA
jgi:hypothetical protein